ncbi:MAG TPA: MFS transporter [Patescibacteria group bacterium]|nr:MFS transporter [Patescibacteria group bacterium]
MSIFSHRETADFSRTPFLLYALMMLAVFTGDAIMSYLSPVLLSSWLGSTTKMGFVFATSSLAGMSMDFFFAKAFGNRGVRFFLRIVMLLGLPFPLSLLVSHQLPSILFAMVVWGIYFEAMVFANYHAVHSIVTKEHFAWAWGILALFRNLSLVIGPALAGFLLQSAERPNEPLFVAATLYGIGILFFIVLRMTSHLGKYHPLTPEEAKPRSIKEELRLWLTLEKTLWPLLGLMLLFYFVDCAFFSVGPLFSEHLKMRSEVGVLFMSMYSVPGLFIGFFTAKLAKPFGKKRIAYVGGIIGGIGLVLIRTVTAVLPILAIVFIASIGLAILWPELTATFEDFIARTGRFRGDLIGLTAIFGSIPYVIGPIVNGFLNDRIGEQNVFAFWGALLVVYSGALFFIVKRKVRLPEQQLVEVAVIEETV